MNRQQRRATEKFEKRQLKSIWPSGKVGVPNDCGLMEGDKFTIKGIQRMKSGKINRNCKEGAETIFIANVV